MSGRIGFYIPQLPRDGFKNPAAEAAEAGAEAEAPFIQAAAAIPTAAEAEAFKQSRGIKIRIR